MEFNDAPHPFWEAKQWMTNYGRGFWLKGKYQHPLADCSLHMTSKGNTISEPVTGTTLNAHGLYHMIGAHQLIRSPATHPTRPVTCAAASEFKGCDIIHKS